MTLILKHTSSVFFFLFFFSHSAGSLWVENVMFTLSRTAILSFERIWIELTHLSVVTVLNL